MARSIAWKRLAAIVLAIAAIAAGAVFGPMIWRRVPNQSQLVRAWQLAARHEWNGVVRELERYVQVRPQDEEAVDLLARAYCELGDFSAGSRLWDSIPSSSPQKRSILIAQGSTLLRGDRAVSAEQAWQQCLTLADQCNDSAAFDQAASELASLFWLQGRKLDIQRLAAQSLGKAFEQRDAAKHQQWLLWQLRVRLLDMEPLEAIERLKRFVASDEQDLHSARALGRNLASIGTYEEAEFYLRRCLILAPNDLQNWLDLIVFMIDAGAIESSEKLIESLPEHSTTSPAFQMAIGRVAHANGDYLGATQAFQRILNQEGRNEQALTQFIGVTRQMGQQEEVLRQARLLEEITSSRQQLQRAYMNLVQASNPSSAECLSIAQACASLGYVRESADWRRQAVILAPVAKVDLGALTTESPSSALGLLMPQEIPNVDQLLQHATARIRTHADQASIRFVNVADQSGVNFNYFRGETGQFWIVEPNGGGVAWLDSDQDGWLDLFFVNGCPLPPGSGVADINKELEWSSRFFRNDGRGGFTDSTLQAGLVTDLYGQGVTVADFDNDGFSDLYVTGYGATALFHNRGDGTFQDVTLLSGTGVTRFSTGCVFTDLNRDGVLDLYVATYVDFDQALHGKPCRNSSTGEAEYCGPRCCPGTPDILFAGNGDGTFKDVSIATGVASEVQPGFSVAAADLNNDDWPDLYVANDGQINTLWLNTTANGSDGSIQLSSCGLALGCGVDADGIAQGSMGIACGDVDRDGFLDLGITNFYHEHFTLYRNAAGNGFEDLSTSYRLLGATRTTMGWGTHFADFDNDGWLDLFVANGHINRSRTGTPPYEMPAQLFRNSGQGSFVEIGPTAGPYFQQHVIGRGSAVGDYDNDGYEDIAVAHHHRPAALLHNNTQPDRTVLAIRLVGSSSSRDAMNARVFATIRTESTATPTELVREICPGTSFLSADDYRIRFGIDRDAQVDIRVHWPSGDRQTWHNLRPGGTVVLREMQSGIAVLP